MRCRLPLLPWWVRWTAVAGLAAFIVYTSIVTVPPETALDRANPGSLDLFQLGLDKWRHFLAYAALGYGLAYATTDWDIGTRYLATLVVLVTALLGIGVECWQSLIPERYLSANDAYANAFGALLVVPWYAVRQRVEFLPLRAWFDSITARD